jgi:hypothetical protein
LRIFAEVQHILQGTIASAATERHPSSIRAGAALPHSAAGRFSDSTHSDATDPARPRTSRGRSDCRGFRSSGLISNSLAANDDGSTGNRRRRSAHMAGPATSSGRRLAAGRSTAVRPARNRLVPIASQRGDVRQIALARCPAEREHDCVRAFEHFCLPQRARARLAQRSVHDCLSLRARSRSHAPRPGNFRHRSCTRPGA